MKWRKLDTLEQIGLSSGFSELIVGDAMVEILDQQVCNYVTSILTLALNGSEEHPHKLHRRLKSTDIVYLLGFEIPRKYDTILQMISQMDNPIIKVPNLVLDNSLSNVLLKARVTYKACGTRDTETHVFLKAVFDHLSKKQRSEVLTKRTNGNNWLLNMLRNSNKTSMVKLLENLEVEDKKMLMLQETDQKQSVLMLAIGVHSCKEVLLLLSQQLPKHDWAEIVCKTDTENRTVLPHKPLARQ